MQHLVWNGDRRCQHVYEVPQAMSMMVIFPVYRRDHVFSVVSESVNGRLSRIVSGVVCSEDFCSGYEQHVMDVGAVSWEIVSVTHLNDWKSSI